MTDPISTLTTGPTAGTTTGPAGPTNAGAATAGVVVASRVPVQFELASSLVDRRGRCPNRNGFWPPINRYDYKAERLPPIELGNRHTRTLWLRVVEQAAKDRALDRTQEDVLRAFAGYSDDQLADVYVSQLTVAHRLGFINDDHVNRVVAHLIHAGWLTVEHRPAICDRESGVFTARTNLTRFTTPADYQPLLQQLREAAHTKAAKTRAARQRPSGRFTPPAVSPAYHHVELPGLPPALEGRDKDRAGAAAFALRVASNKHQTINEARAVIEARYSGDLELLDVAVKIFDELIIERRSRRRTDWPPG
jgi:hypothetical protein